MANEAVASSDNVAGTGIYKGAEVEGAVVSDGAYSVIVADFSSEETAKQAYKALKDLDDDKAVKVEGVLVVKREEDGDIKVQKMTDHSTRHGVGWGAVGGLVVGVLFPPSVVGSVLVGSLGGAAVGGIRKHHHKKEVAQELDNVLKIGHSGLVALVSRSDELSIQQVLAKADSVVAKAIDDQAAEEIKTAALAAQAEEA